MSSLKKRARAMAFVQRGKRIVKPQMGTAGYSKIARQMGRHDVTIIGRDYSMRCVAHRDSRHKGGHLPKKPRNAPRRR